MYLKMYLIKGIKHPFVVKCKSISIRDWSKRIGGGGPEHLEMWLIKNTSPTPSLRHKND